MKFNKKSLIKIGGAMSALVSSFGLVFGLAIANSTSEFLNFDSPKYSLSYFEETPQDTKKNVDGVVFKIPENEKVDYKSQIDSKAKFNFAAQVIDGASHQILDKSFNQSGYQGLVDWIWTNDWYDQVEPPSIAPLKDPTPTYDDNNEGSANGVKPPSDNVNEFWKTYSNLVNSKYRTLVLPGYMHQSGLSIFKNKDPNNYLNAGYILLDADTEDSNIASVIFRADEAAFMTGIAACQYLNDNFQEYSSGGLRVGTFGGIAIPSVTIYMGGFEYGIKVWNDNVETIAANNPELGWANPEEHKVNIINLGIPDSFFSNSFSIGDGKQLVQALLQRGADVIMPVAGPQTIDTVREIKAQKSNCIVVGVDTAQENDPTTNNKSVYKDKNNNNDIIKFSAAKNIPKVTSQILSMAMARVEEDESKHVGAFGYLTVGDYRNEGILPTENSLNYLIKFIKEIYGGNVPSPDDPPEIKYEFILEQLSGSDPEHSTNYFDQDHISNENYMKFRI